MAVAGRRSLRGFAAWAALWSLVAPAPALAFDFFGLFGRERVEASATALTYQVEVRGLEGDREAASAINDVSILHRLRAEPPVDGDELLRRAESDLPRMVDALWGSGYYAARLQILVGGQPVTLERGAAGASRAALDRMKGRAVVPVVVAVEPGPLYRFGRIAILDQRSGLPFAPADLPDRVAAAPVGEPARTQALLTTAARISDHFRDRGHPFVRVVRRQPVIDHRARRVDLALAVDPGAVARLGRIGVAGTRDVDPAVVRSFIYAEHGDPYSPRAIADIRKSVARIEAIGGVRVREAERLEPDGTLPLTVEVTERPLRVLGGSVRYSTVDGPALKAYWAHRNLFGGAERLRLDADLFYFTGDQRWPGGNQRRGLNLGDLGGRLSLSFLKPALWGSRTDFLFDAYYLRESTEFYSSNLVNATAALRRRFTDTFSAQIGIEGEVGRSIDPLGRNDYGLLGVPVSMTYDSTDRPLDPTRGIRAIASITPYAGFGDAPRLFAIGRAQLSGYYALDEAARTILAGRVAFGTILGGSLAEIPAARRFYAGGGGSVRGFDYKSLGPRDGLGFVTGGKSLVEASVEARIRLTDTIGIVPFLDVGQAFASSFPDGSERLRAAVGLGFRYYTAVGPIRVDVATPLGRRRGESPYALYISLGQAF